MHNDANKNIRDDHLETLVLVSEDLKHMQAMVEMFELRRAECIKKIQTIPTQYETLSKISRKQAVGCNWSKTKKFTNIRV